MKMCVLLGCGTYGWRQQPLRDKLMRNACYLAAITQFARISLAGLRVATLTAQINYRVGGQWVEPICSFLHGSVKCELVWVAAQDWF